MSGKQAPLLTIFAFSLVLGSCSSDPYPSILIEPTYTYRPGHFVWHELGTSNLSSSREFYGALFRWKFTDYNTGTTPYLLIENEGQPIGGMIKIPEDQSSHWIGTLSAESTENVVQEALKAGGDVLIGATKVTGRGSMALVKDPQGAFVSFIHSNFGDPQLEVVNSNEWLWMELWSDNPEASINYYKSLYGYTVEERSLDNQPYWILSKDNIRIAGVMKNPISNMPTRWVPYIKVYDPAETTKKAAALGATILMEPRQDIRQGTVGVISDPNGAIFCVQKWPVI
jgi:predicted enzyme related to lactoylglutathione lyase